MKKKYIITEDEVKEMLEAIKERRTHKLLNVIRNLEEIKENKAKKEA